MTINFIDMHESFVTISSLKTFINNIVNLKSLNANKSHIIILKRAFFPVPVFLGSLALLSSFIPGTLVVTLLLIIYVISVLRCVIKFFPNLSLHWTVSKMVCPEELSPSLLLSERLRSGRRFLHFCYHNVKTTSRLNVPSNVKISVRSSK